LPKLAGQSWSDLLAVYLLHALELAVGVMEQHRELIREELVLDRFGSGNGIRH
jgi:hypothetical protein